MRQVAFTVEFDGATGEATIQIAEGPGKRLDAQAIARLTEQLGEALGETIERHIGDHEHAVGISHHAGNHITTGRS